MKANIEGMERRNEPWAVHGLGVLGVLVGVALYMATTALLAMAMRSWSSNETLRFVHDVLLKRGLIPHLEALGFWIGLSLLLLQPANPRSRTRFSPVFARREWPAISGGRSQGMA
jgi:hypothetical protein